jgi:hypothetical protein
MRVVSMLVDADRFHFLRAQFQVRLRSSTMHAIPSCTLMLEYRALSLGGLYPFIHSLALAQHALEKGVGAERLGNSLAGKR